MDSCNACIKDGPRARICARPLGHEGPHRDYLDVEWEDQPADRPGERAL